MTANVSLHVSVRPPLADSWYSLCYLYFAAVGTASTVVFGLLVSMMTGGCKQTLNPDVLVKKSDLICFSWCSKSEASNVPVKAAADLHMEADNPAFTDGEMKSKDAEQCTKL